MAVYVDEIRWWPTRIRCFKAGSAHLTADSLDELHDLARRIGLRAEWFQGTGRVPHYDLTPAKRTAALLAGAVFVGAKEQARRRIIAARERASEFEEQAAWDRYRGIDDDWSPEADWARDAHESEVE